MKQIEINQIVEEMYNYLYNGQHERAGNTKRLRSCTAEVIDLDDLYVLRSYNTVIACIDKETGNCFDFLRLVYGYTNTSCQHVRKFAQDYCRSGNVYTWRRLVK